MNRFSCFGFSASAYLTSLLATAFFWPGSPRAAQSAGDGAPIQGQAALPFDSGLPPGNIEARGPQQFIVSDFTSSEPVDEVTAFRYTVKVDTRGATDNVYYYLAQYFSPAQGKHSLYYSGIQPHADGTVRFVFSYFGRNAVPESKHCRPGADRYQGVSCGVKLKSPYVPGQSYTVAIKKTNSDTSMQTYTGSVKDEASGKETIIGAWSIPIDAGVLKPRTVNVVERYNGRSPVRSCNDIPLVRAEWLDLAFNGLSGATLPKARKPKPHRGVYMCAGVTRATSGTVTAAPHGYIVSNSD